MGRLKRYFFCLFFLIYLSLNSFSQNIPSVTVTGHVFAEVIPVCTAVEISQLNFGRFSPGPSGGEIVLSPESSINTTGSIRLGSGLHNAASFYVTGDAETSFTITLPAEPVVLRHVSSPKTMIIDNWISTPGNNSGAGILQNGEQIVYIGASLKVGTVNDNPVGRYAGTYTVTFEFN